MNKGAIIVIVGMIIAIVGGKSGPAGVGTVLFGLFLILIGIGAFFFGLGSRKKTDTDGTTNITVNHNHYGKK